MDSLNNLWKPDYLLNIELIDTQHRGFFDICLTANMLCETGRRSKIQLQELIHILYRMRGYAFKHFHTEEALLLDYNYPKLYTHLRLHDQFLASFQVFTEEIHGHFSENKTPDPAAVLTCAEHINEYVVNWWGDHILTADKEFSEFILAQKKRKT